MSVSWPFLFSALWLIADTAAAQPRIRDANPHAWLVYYGDLPVRNSKWGVLTEMQIRRADWGSAWQQLLLREGLTYRIAPKVQLGGGYGFIRTARYGDFPVPAPFKEHRMFEQVVFQHEAGKLALEHRYRLEQRWLEVPGATAYWRYQDRFRYQFRAVYPLRGTSYAIGGSELFLHFGPNHGASIFDQNRAFLGLGYRVNSTHRLELSYLNQFLVQRSGVVEESNHTIRFQVTANFKLPR